MGDTYSDPARHAATLARILELRGQAILADEAAFRQALAAAETECVDLYRGLDDRHAEEAEERWGALADRLYRAGEITLRIRENIANIRIVRAKLARVREVLAGIDPAGAAEREAEAEAARKAAAAEAAKPRQEADGAARRVEAGRVKALTQVETQAEAQLAKLSARWG